MVEAGALLVPTRFIVEFLVARAKALNMPDYAKAKIDAIAGRHLEAMQIAVEAGVQMALGTDIFVRSAIGQNGAEVGYLAKAGLTPLQAIEAATANGPLTVGPQAPKSGQLAEGFDADIVTLDANPLDDLSVLEGSEHVTAVWKAGAPVV